MANPITRRELLEMGAAIPVVGAQDPQKAPMQQGGEQTVSGTVETVTGVGVGGADVVAYDSDPESSPVELGRGRTRTASGEIGSFEFLVSTPQNQEQSSELPLIHLVARKPDPQRTDHVWFATTKFPPGDSKDEQDLVLDRQLLFSPADPTTGNYGAGAVSAWRWIDDSDPAKQVFYIEIVGTVPVGGEFPDDPWRFGDATTTRWTEIDRAEFSVTLPEHVDVAYGQEITLDRIQGTLPLQTAVYEALDGESARRTLQKWHPVRPPELPAFELDGYPDPASLGAYQPFADANLEDRTVKRETERRIEGTLSNAMATTALSVATLGLSEASELALDLALTAAEGQSWGIEETVNANVGDEYADPTADVERPSPNVADIVSSGWIGERSAVAYQVPVIFDRDRMEGETIDLITEAKWRSPTPRNTSARFGKKLSVGFASDFLEVSDEAGTPAWEHSPKARGSQSANIGTTVSRWVTAEDMKINPTERDFSDPEDAFEPESDIDLNLRVEEPATGKSITVRSEAGPRDYAIQRIDVDVYTASGEIGNDPSIYIDQPDDPIQLETTVTGDRDIFLGDTFSAYLVEVFDGDESLGATESRIVGIGYETRFEQTDDTVRITRDSQVDPQWFVEFRIVDPDDIFETLARTAVTNRETEDLFTISVADVDLDPGEYPWYLDMYATPEYNRYERLIGISSLAKENRVSIS